MLKKMTQVVAAAAALTLTSVMAQPTPADDQGTRIQAIAEEA